MKRMIALLLLLCMLTACAAPVPETEEPTAASQEIASRNRSSRTAAR